MKTKSKIYAALGLATVKAVKTLSNRRVRTVLGDYRRGRKVRLKG